MAKYNIAYTCGHSETVNLIGPHRSRESRIAFLERGECFECYKQQINQISSKQAEELELPALVGSEKQIAWAETLRIKKLTEIEDAVERLVNDKAYRHVLMAVEKISNETSAKQWIEWRFMLPMQIINSVLHALLNEPTEEQKQQALAEQKKAQDIQRAALVEATLRPESPITKMIAEIRLNNNTISVSLREYREDFREIVKTLGYAWIDGCWQRTIDTFAGTPMDRATELGHTLLSHRFAVRAFDEQLRSKIIAGEFEPEQTRWISVSASGNHVGWFCVWWGCNEDYYDVARKIKHSKYSSPYVVVPPVQFEQVLDFAQMYDFRLSNGAQEAVRMAKEDKESTLIVKKKPVAKRTKKQPLGDKPPVLSIPEVVSVADELRDEN